MAKILYRMKIGCQWHTILNEFGSDQTCHRRFQTWERTVVFKRFINSF
ncbi:transposase [Leptospira kirschneri]